MEPESQWWGVNPTGGEAKEVLPTTNTTTSPSLKDLSIQWANQPAPSTVTAQSLSPEPLIQLPPTQQDSPQALQGTTAGTLSSFEKMMEQFVNPPKTELQQQSDDMRTRILEQLGALGGEEQRLMEREQEAGIPQMREKLGEISTQLQNLQMEAQQIPLEIQQESIGRGRTAAGVAPLQQARLRENAIRSLSLSAIGNTLTGQLAAAQDSVDRAIRMEFEPIRREIDFLQNAYQFIREDLSAEEKRRGDAMNLMLRERERLIASQEDERRQIFSMAQAAIQAGADLQTVERIQRAGTMEEAQRLIAESGVLSQPVFDTMTDASGATYEVQRDPRTGQIIGTPRQVFGGKGTGVAPPITKTINGQDVQWNPSTGQWEAIQVSGVPEGSLGISPEAEQVLRNPALLKDYTPTERGRLLTEIARAGGSAQTVAQESTNRMVTQAIGTIGTLRNTKTIANLISQLWGGGEFGAVKRATGITGIISPFQLGTRGVPGTAGRDAMVLIDTLKDQLALPQLEFAAGMGRMSQEQFRTLYGSAQSLDQRMSTDMFIKEIQRIEKTLLEVQAQAAGRGAASLQFNDDDYAAYLRIINGI
jgi:hypothetical protein